MGQDEVEACLREHGDLTCREIASILECPYYTITAYLERLQVRGVVRVTGRKHVKYASAFVYSLSINMKDDE